MVYKTLIYSHSGLDQHESEEVMTDFSFLGELSLESEIRREGCVVQGTHSSADLLQCFLVDGVAQLHLTVQWMFLIVAD